MDCCRVNFAFTFMVEITISKVGIRVTPIVYFRQQVVLTLRIMVALLLSQPNVPASYFILGCVTYLTDLRQKQDAVTLSTNCSTNWKILLIKQLCVTLWIVV